MGLELLCGAGLFAALFFGAVKYNQKKRASRELYRRECRWNAAFDLFKDAKWGVALLTFRRTVKFGFILAMVVAMAGWTTFLGWMVWYLADWVISWWITRNASKAFFCWGKS
jgi:hypothetical protein